jgi:NAD(P)-dependent dehydrogenase (short-subunit alcohol dehydrogenase family)
MSERTDRLLLVIGSGPGIGNTTASLFAQKRFNKIALIARNATRLQDDKEGVEKAARDAGREVEVRTWSLDVSDIPKLKETLAETEKFGQIEAVFFNAARVIESPFFSHPESEIRYDFEVCLPLSSCLPDTDFCIRSPQLLCTPPQHGHIHSSRS